MSIQANDLKRGMAVGYKGGVWVCVGNKKVAKGKGQSYQSVSLKNVATGQNITERFRTTEDFEEAFLDRKTLTYLYSEPQNHVLMDNESYEQIHVPAELVGDAKVFLKEDLPVEVSFVDGKAITVELPNTVELTVTDTPPEVKGATATNQLKDAVCQGGARVKVPPFIENGQVIRVDTRTGEYLGKA